jgi:hypothetical protein
VQTTTFFAILPIALFWAFSPVIISVVILLLSTKKPVQNTMAFTLPAIFGSMAVGIILIVVASGQNYSANTTPSDLSYLAQVICGLVFFIILGLVWWKLPKGGRDMKLPKWVTYLDKIDVKTALVYGGILFLNNVFLTITACINILQGQQSQARDIVSVIAFVLVGTVGLWIPLTYRIVAPKSSPAKFENWREWLIVHNRDILILEFGILGVLQLVQGIVGLVK